MPIGSTPKHCDRISASSFSCHVRGATYSSASVAGSLPAPATRLSFLRRQWQLLQRHEHRRHHVLRQLPFQVLPQLFGRQALLPARHQIPHQPLLFTLICSRQHYCFSKGRMLPQHRLDLTQLDAEASDLYLLVQSPEVSMSPPANAAPIPAAIQPRAWFPAVRMR